MRIIALDVGEKYIGVAISDPLAISAQGMATIERVGKADTIERLRKIVNEYEVDRIVVGMPLNIDGTKGTSAYKIDAFIEILQQELSLPVDSYDERLTTIASERVLDEAGVSKYRRKQHVDRIAALLILQGYLDRMHAEGEE